MKKADDWKRDDQATQDLLKLGSDRLVMLSVIATWTDAQCREAEAFASAAHFRASDNAVRVPTMPAHLAACPRRAIGVEDADLTHL